MAPFPGWMRKNFIPGNSSWRVSGRNMRWKLLQNCVPNTCDISPLKKIFFQISLKYIKLVIPIILFILVLCNFNFYFKITWTPSHQQYNPAPPKMKFSDPPPPLANTFLKFLTSPPSPSWRRGCMPWVWRKRYRWGHIKGCLYNAKASNFLPLGNIEHNNVITER